ncbi:hypothetical protein [Microlunatus soli]|uniref:Uncharacterized protein n=1 Tax=Microlunatus soli TaxID=630515 RepID=A0A1H1RTK3_9ACTN|nr:hypothetical protein [Microlunatus soli]SDS38339.1 hypothetical protein SAMN04489812_1743 [Microlunatus soli]
MTTGAGQLVSETLDHDGGRQATAYIFADATQAVGFAGVGQLISQWGDLLNRVTWAFG